MLYLGYVLLRYVVIYKLEEFCNFRLPFLQLNVIKMKTVFSLFLAIFLEFLTFRTFFDFPWRFELSGVDCISKEEADTRGDTLGDVAAKALVDRQCKALK